MGKVLVLGSDTRSFLAVVRSLGRRGLEVHIGWCPLHSPASHSRYLAKTHQIPECAPNDENWKTALIRLIEREQFDLVVPCDDPTVIPLQVNRAAFAPLECVYLLSEHAFEIAFDKSRSYELARSLGIRVPRGMVIDHQEDLASLSDLQFPVVLKPRMTFRPDDLVNRNPVRTARDVDQLASLVSLMPAEPVLVQEHFAGIGAGVELLADNGEVLVAFQHVRVHEPPVGGGSSYRKSVALDPALYEAAAALISALRYTGVAMVEFKIRPQTGDWAFMEINGRFWGSLPLAVAAGVDFPYYLFELLVHGRRTFPQDYPAGLYCRNLWLDAVWMLQNSKAAHRDSTLITVPWSQVVREAFRPLTLRERSDTLVRDDLRPAFVELGHLLAVLRARVAGKLRAFILTLPTVRKHQAARARASLRRAQTILFVCKGNICRSPFAERYAGRLLPKSTRVRSCGYHPRAGRSAPREAVEAADALGVDLHSHRSTVISEGMVQEADVILVFDHEDYATVVSRYPHARRRVFPLGLLAPEGPLHIRDPYGNGRREFESTYSMISSVLREACTG